MDTTLVSGILTRVDILANQLGVAAGDIWSIWLSLNYRPLMDCLTLLVVSSMVMYPSYRIVKWAYEDEHNREGYLILSSIAFFMAFLAALVAVVCLPDAIIYFRNPEAYALSQLAEMIGGK